MPLGQLTLFCWLPTWAPSDEPFALRSNASSLLEQPTNTQGKCSSGRVHDNTLRSFLKSLKVLKTGYKPPRFVIGVVGQSGAGKSLLLNALLEAK